VHGTDDGLKQLTATAHVSAYGETFDGTATTNVRVDSTPPSPSIECPSAGNPGGNFAMSWGASDASGIASYEVLVSTDGGSFTPWLSGTSGTSAAYSGQPGHSYSFQVSATDALGNASGFVSCGPVAIRVATEPTTPPPGDGLEPYLPMLPAAANLRVAKVVLHGTRVTVAGSLARTATGSVSGSYAASGAHVVRAHAQVARGRYELVFHLTRGLRRARRAVVRVSYSGDRLHAAQRLSRRVRR
jgi:hypothetical protein